MHRRRFIASLAAVTTATPTLHAEQKAMPVIGVLSVVSPPANPGDLVRGPIHEGMGEMGFVEGPVSPARAATSRALPISSPS